MTPEELSTLVVDVLRAAASDGRLEIEVPEAVVIERPKNRDHGDWATTAALQLAKQAGRPPREVAEFKHPFIEHFFQGERGRRAMSTV